MRNLRAVAAQLKPLFENPEIGAMAEISEILQALPDDAARLRVMRWSFARFGGDEFKRALPNPAPQPEMPQAHAAAAAIVVEPRAIEVNDPGVEHEDLAHQVSELQDLFPQRAAKLRQV